MHAAGRETEDLATALTDGLETFTSAVPINQFLSRLLLLLAQDRISPRRGAVMAYTANLLLRSVSVMEQSAEKESQQPPIITYEIAIPRPQYDDAATEQQTAAGSPHYEQFNDATGHPPPGSC